MRRTGERGSATVFLLGFATVLMVAAGLVIDGGLAMNGRERITDDAEQAARYGANALDQTALRSGTGLVVDSTAATDLATGFMADRGYHDIDVQVDGNAVTVSAAGTVDTVLLSLAGIGSFTVRGEATAVAVDG
jgi:Flp pilus assembly protein TadG